MTQGSDTPAVLVNGRPGDRIGVNDRGLTVGDGLFETIAIRSGRPRFWPAHYQRLAEGCRRLGIPAPDRDTLAADIGRLVDGQGAGTIRLTVTRGPGARGYAPPAEPTPTRIAAFYPASAAEGTPAHSVALRWCRTRVAIQPALAGIKHLNRLEQVLARSEWVDPAVDEGLMCTADGRVVEAVAANLFLVRGNRLITPAVRDCGVAGVMRARVLDAVQCLDIDAEVRDVDAREVETADALFLTSAVRGLAPVARVGDRGVDPGHPLIPRLSAQIETMD